MKQTMFLKGVIFLIGITVLALCIFVLPASIISDKTGYYRPILLGMYVPAIPFFFALYQALRILSSIDKNKAFSQVSVKALMKIKYCGIAIAALFSAGMPLIFNAADKDDAPGAVAIALVIILASITVATFAAVLQKLLKDALDIKTENDLTV